MQSSELRGHRFGSHRVPEFIGKASLEVISHFRFQLHAWAHIEGDPSAQAYEVAGWPGLTEAKIFRKNTDFNMIRVLLRHNHRGSRNK